MGVIKDIKKGWEIGRDRVSDYKNNRKISKSYGKTLDMLEDELGEDAEREETDSRGYRLYQEMYENDPKNIKMSNKYPRGFVDEENKLGHAGMISNIIAEKIPRKKKCSCKPKRKLIKKSCKKK